MPATVSWAEVSPGPRVAAAHRRRTLGCRPDRYYNLLAQPDVRIEVGDTAFAEQADRYPGFAGYQRKTRRVIPVVALTPTDEGSAPADRTERTAP
ncbi:hypothetical protein [Streptomyces sp. NPDC091215]|uniref:hypothetical protein n=1 Tax=Streptomyces sp. NPDC091215 TaxID=3155192 RepID=UPI00344548AE